MIAIIDYGIGNVGSILNMFKKIGSEAIITSSASDIGEADKIVLPGIGAFDEGIERFNDLGLLDILNEKVIKDKAMILGICLGMQMFTKGSEEGKLRGFGWIDGETARFRLADYKNLKTPHFGWNKALSVKESFLFKNMDAESKFYFAHSYHVVCNSDKDILSETTYGYEFISAIQKENIIGVQFHPEKSHRFGLQLLKNFAEASQYV